MTIKNEKNTVNPETHDIEKEQGIEVVLQPVVTPTPEPLSEGTPAKANANMDEAMPFDSVVEEVIEANPTKPDSIQNEEKEEENGVQLVPAPSNPPQSEEEKQENSVLPEPVPCV